MTAGLDGLAVACPSPSALAAARRRIGVASLRALFDLLRGPAAGLATTGVYWRGRLVTAVDGTMLCCPDTGANLAVYRRHRTTDLATAEAYVDPDSGEPLPTWDQAIDAIGGTTNPTAPGNGRASARPGCAAGGAVLIQYA